MTNYNDGNWHGWNGGECPVHPKSNIIYVYQSIATAETGLCHITEDIAANAPWGSAIAFRVVKEHREPREFWVCVGDGTQPAYGTPEAAEIYRARSRNVSIIHVQEKMP